MPVTACDHLTDDQIASTAMALHAIDRGLTATAALELRTMPAATLRHAGSLLDALATACFQIARQCQLPPLHAPEYHVSYEDTL